MPQTDNARATFKKKRATGGLEVGSSPAKTVQVQQPTPFSSRRARPAHLHRSDASQARQGRSRPSHGSESCEIFVSHFGMVESGHSTPDASWTLVRSCQNIFKLRPIPPAALRCR